MNNKKISHSKTKNKSSTCFRTKDGVNSWLKLSLTGIRMKRVFVKACRAWISMELEQTSRSSLRMADLHLEIEKRLSEQFECYKTLGTISVTCKVEVTLRVISVTIKKCNLVIKHLEDRNRASLIQQ